jgi:hypothetical protein
MRLGRPATATMHADKVRKLLRSSLGSATWLPRESSRALRNSCLESTATPNIIFCPGGQTVHSICYFEVQGWLVSVMLAISQRPSRLTRLKMSVPQWSGLPLRIASYAPHTIAMLLSIRTMG